MTGNVASSRQLPSILPPGNEPARPHFTRSANAIPAESVRVEADSSIVVALAKPLKQPQLTLVRRPAPGYLMRKAVHRLGRLWQGNHRGQGRCWRLLWLWLYLDGH